MSRVRAAPSEAAVLIPWDARLAPSERSAVPAAALFDRSSRTVRAPRLSAASMPARGRANERHPVRRFPEIPINRGPPDVCHDAASGVSMCRLLGVCFLVVGLFALSACGAPACPRSVTIRNNQDWANFVAAGCTSIPGELAFDAPGLAVLTPPATALAAVGSLTVSSRTGLTSLSMPALTTLNEGLSITNNNALTSLSLPVLKTASGALVVDTNIALTSISLPALTTCAVLFVADNTALTSLNLPALTSLSGSLNVHSNTALRQCLVDAIKNQLTPVPNGDWENGNNGMPNTCP